MRWLIEYIKSCFCNHKFEYGELHAEITGDFNEIIKQGIRVSATCSKCGYHKSYWKFL
jgi:hypothetical protein